MENESDNILDNMALIKESELNNLEADLEYWYLISIMLSEKLINNSIEHEVSEESLAKWLETQDRNLQ